MIIHTTNAFAGPFLLLVWLLDFYLIVSSIRLVLPWVGTDWAQRTALRLAPIVDPIPTAVSRAMSPRGGRPLPTWLPWVIVFFAAMMVRQALVSFMLCAR